MKVKLFADGAVISEMVDCYNNGTVQGFTTNPTLMRQAGIEDYESFAKEALEKIPDAPISFEVFSDDFPDMHRQALKLNELASNVYVKIPITNTKGESSLPLVQSLVLHGVKVNVTAIMTANQVRDLAPVLSAGVPSVVSVFAGRIADSLRDPEPIMRECRLHLSYYKLEHKAELLWASCREVYNIKQADDCGCQIVTVSPSILKKLKLKGKDLKEYSLETVQMFYDDASQAGYKL
jgi:transaldolase